MSCSKRNSLFISNRTSQAFGNCYFWDPPTIPCYHIQNIVDAKYVFWGSLSEPNHGISFSLSDSIFVCLFLNRFVCFITVRYCEYLPLRLSSRSVPPGATGAEWEILSVSCPIYHCNIRHISVHMFLPKMRACLWSASGGSSWTETVGVGGFEPATCGHQKMISQNESTRLTMFDVDWSY